MSKMKQKKRFFISILAAFAVSAITAGAVYGAISTSGYNSTTSQTSRSNAAKASSISTNVMKNARDVGADVVPGLGTKPNISLANLPSLPQGLNTSTYAIDLTANTRLKINFLNYINEHPTYFFERVPERPANASSEDQMINPESATFDISADGSSVIISVRYLTGFNQIFGTGIYEWTKILVTGFNTTPTTMINTIDASGFQIDAPSLLTPTSPSLLNFLRNPATINTIFQNAPLALVNNPNAIVVNSLSYPDDLNGQITANITANNALLPVVGFKQISGDILITGINSNNSNLPSITNTVIDVNTLPNEIINSTMYSIDAYNRNVNISASALVNYMNQNPELFITNPVMNANVNQFTNFSFSYTANTLVVNCSYLYQYVPTSQNSTIYASTTLTFTGFNTQPTTINPSVSQNGLDLSIFFAEILPSEVATNADNLNTLKRQISNQLANIFVNYPEAFINATRNSINTGLTVSNPNDQNGTLRVEIPTVNAFSNGNYANTPFAITVNGFASQNETTIPDVSIKDITGLSIPGIDSTVFSADVKNSISHQRTIETFMNANPQLFLNNPIVSNDESNPTFKDFTYRYNYSNASELSVDCLYLAKYDTSYHVGEYLPASFKFSGFNSSPTTVNREFTTTSNSSGFYLQGFSRILSSELESNLNLYKSSIEEQLNLHKNIVLTNAPLSSADNSSITITGVHSTNQYIGEVILNIQVSNVVVGGMYSNLVTQIKCSGFSSGLISTANTSLKNVQLDANKNISLFEEVFSGSTTGGVQTILSNGYTVDWLNASSNELMIAANNLRAYINTHIDSFFNNPSNTQVSSVTITRATDQKYIVGMQFNGLIAGVENQNIVNNNAFEIILRQSPNSAVVANNVQNGVQDEIDRLSETFNRNLTLSQFYDLFAKVLNNLRLPNVFYPVSGSFTANDIRDLIPNVNVDSSVIIVPAFTIGQYPNTIYIDGLTINNPLYKVTNSNSSNQSKPLNNDDQWIVWVCIGVVSGVALLALIAFILWWNWDSIKGKVNRNGSPEDYSEYYDDYFDDNY